MTIKELLEKRKGLKRKKPEFVYQDAHKKVRIPWKWRRPRGSGSKMRIGMKGYRRPLEVGWGSPKSVEGLDRNGLMPAVVHNTAELAKLDPKKDIVVIASSVGTKKKITIIEQAAKKGLKISNFKDAEKFAKDAKDGVEKRKNEKRRIKEAREKKKETALKDAEKKKAKEAKEAKKEGEAPATDEEKKIEDKKEKDKMLISTQ
jgi:large subunit ribosomal protein L32e